MREKQKQKRGIFRYSDFADVSENLFASLFHRNSVENSPPEVEILMVLSGESRTFPSFPVSIPSFPRDTLFPRSI